MAAPKVLPHAPKFIESLGDDVYVAIAGPNNAGKSVYLKWLAQHLGDSCLLAAANRFYQDANLQQPGMPRPNRDEVGSAENSETNWLHVGSALNIITDEDRKRIFNAAGELIGAPIELKRRDPANDLSGRYVAVGGREFSTASTGTRLLVTLFALAAQKGVSVLLIDEPELGLSPRVQTALRDLFSDQVRLSALFPHIKRVIVATHSHIFLDRRNIRANWIVSSEGSDKVVAQRVETAQEFANLQFNLLGNDFESLLLPAAIVLVEGKTDRPFIEAVIAKRFPGRKVVVRDSSGDVKGAINQLRDTLGDLHAGAYGGRVFAVLDSVHSKGSTDSISRAGLQADRIVVWAKNGIEYVYPPALMAELFRVHETDLHGLVTESDNVSLAGTSVRKVELMQRICGRIDAQTVHANELEEKLLRPLALAMGEPVS